MRHRRPTSPGSAARIAAATLAFAWFATDAARPGIPATSELVAASDITAISGLRPVETGGNERLSALLVADARSGSVWSFDSSAPPSVEVTPGQLKQLIDFASPRAIAHSDWGACVWDAGPRALICFDLFDGRTWQVWTGEPFRSPTRLAVSPDGTLAVVDKEAGGLFWFAPPELSTKSAYADAKRQPFQLPELADLDPVAVAFLAWDKLAVLDRSRDSIVTVEFVFDGYRLAVRGRQELPLVERGRLRELRAIAAQDGVLYVADEERIYIHLENEKRLVAASPLGAGQGAIRQVAASYHDLFALDASGRIGRFPRTVPVDVTLEGSPDVDQSALIDLYRYLRSHGLLETREVVARTDFPSLESMLLTERVLIVPPAVYRAAGMPRAELKRRHAESATWTDSEKRLESLGELVCDLNRDFCAGGRGSPLARPVPAGTRLELPSLRPQSRLRKREVELEGLPPAWYVDRMVFSGEQRAKGSDDLVRRLNPDPEAMKKTGRATLPYEAWFATVAVPVADVDSRDSELRRLVGRYAGVELYKRAKYTRQMASAVQDPPDPPGPPGSALCGELKEDRRAWLASIHYPFCRGAGLENKTLDPRFEAARVAVGVLEKKSQLGTHHQVFELDRANPAWYDPVDFELVAQEFSDHPPVAGQGVDSRTVFSRDFHHGTHVAALLGGRSGNCWSGLLPHSRLLLVDVDSPGSVRDRVLAAISTGVRAFNVSQELTTNGSTDDDLEAINKLLTVEAKSAIFVVAAGNEGKDFNTAVSVRLPAALGRKPNVVTVTAVDVAQGLLPTFVTEANAGKLLVDLAAPGVGIVSATAEDQSFGAASGTSQAAPAVAAAAAYLIDDAEGAKQTPGDVKARLIATANWNPALAEKVWGGLFDFGDAVRYPERAMLQTVSGGEAKLYSVVAPPGTKFRVTNAPRYHERETEVGRLLAHSELFLKWILSLKRNGDGTHRVVFRDPDELKLFIVPNARLSGEIRCTTLERLNETTLTFEPRNQDCAPSIGVDQILEYVAAMPYHVEW